MIGIGLVKLFIYLIGIYLFLIVVENINKSLKK